MKQVILLCIALSFGLLSCTSGNLASTNKPRRGLKPRMHRKPKSTHVCTVCNKCIEGKRREIVITPDGKVLHKKCYEKNRGSAKKLKVVTLDEHGVPIVQGQNVDIKYNMPLSDSAVKNWETIYGVQKELATLKQGDPVLYRIQDDAGWKYGRFHSFLKVDDTLTQILYSVDTAPGLRSISQSDLFAYDRKSLNVYDPIIKQKDLEKFREHWLICKEIL